LIKQAKEGLALEIGRKFKFNAKKIKLPKGISFKDETKTDTSILKEKDGSG
jgi:hypothetical protein